MTAADDVLQALRARQSINRVTAETPPRTLIEQMITAAGWAPNHYRTQPWRFIVLTGKAREALGDVQAETLRQRLEDPDSAESAELLARERRKPLRAPVIIVAAAVPSDLPKVREIEEVAATAAAVQNLLLAAHVLGLGAMWRTGPLAYDPAVKEFLGLPPNAHIVALVYVGYSDLPESSPRERDALACTTWRGWDD